ncbi:MAG: hypothetical protein ACK5IB_13570 [Qingshengfaniella sp.]
MDQYLVYFVPFIVVGFGIMLAPFISYGWPNWLTRFVEFCAEMANGVWVAGVALVILLSLGVPLPAAAVISWPVCSSRVDTSRGLAMNGRLAATKSSVGHGKNANGAKRMNAQNAAKSAFTNS